MKKTKPKLRPVQIFQSSNIINADAKEILEFIESFQQMIHQQNVQSTLALFKLKAKENGLKYQSKIIALMNDWLKTS